MRAYWDDQTPEPKSGLLNVAAVETWDAIWWVEDETDIRAMAVAGFKQTVALAPGARADDVLRHHGEDMEPLTQIVLCLPSTPTGRRLVEVLTARLGAHRCWVVEWPKDCDGASATAVALGTARLAQTIHRAQRCEIKGVQRIKLGTIALHIARPKEETITTGTITTDRILKIPTEGRLIIVTGWPGHGKSNWTRFVMVHTARRHNRRWAVFSPEMLPYAQFATECAEVYHRKPAVPKLDLLERMTPAEVREAELWLSERVFPLACDSEDEAPSLDWLLTTARATVLRDGVTDLLIDPWNELEHTRTDMSETDYIGRALQRLKAFGNRHRVNVWVVAHPAKPPALRQGEKRGVPGPYDIAGSAHWANKPDVGLTVHSPANGEAEIHVWKSRHGWATRGDVAKLEFDRTCAIYLDKTAAFDALTGVTASQDGYR